MRELADALLIVALAVCFLVATVLAFALCLVVLLAPWIVLYELAAS